MIKIGRGPKPIHRIMESIGVDGDEFQGLGRMLRDQRLPHTAMSKNQAYSAGIVDGMVLGVRAVLAAIGEIEKVGHE